MLKQHVAAFYSKLKQHVAAFYNKLKQHVSILYIFGSINDMLKHGTTINLKRNML